MKKLLFVFAFFLVTETYAAEIAGVKLEEKIQLDTHLLQLNGAGLRSKFFIKVYAAALYLGEKKHTAADVLADGGAKRMLFHLLRDVSGKQMLDALNEVIPANHSVAEMKALEARLNTFSMMFASVVEVKKGEVITFDYVPDGGTRVVIGGIDKGHIDGLDFNRALLKVWVGDKPAQEDLKRSLLGVD